MQRENDPYYAIASQIILCVHTNWTHFIQDGCTCLHMAAESGNIFAVKYLVEAGGKELLLAADNVTHFSNDPMDHINVVFLSYFQN